MFNAERQMGQDLHNKALLSMVNKAASFVVAITALCVYKVGQQ